MKKIYIICKYCDYRWIKLCYNEIKLEDMECPKCRDKDLIFKKEDDKIDYYD